MVAGPGQVPATGAAGGRPKIFGFAGYSGSGKTTLIEQLIPRLARGGRRIGLLKHTHHAFEIDKPGKDSYRHRMAGASEVLVASSRRWAMVHELRGDPEPSIDELLTHFARCDLVIIEGYKHAPIAKMEVYRAVTGKPMLHVDDAHVVAIATDTPIATQLPVFDLNDFDAITAFIEDLVGMGREAADAVR
ncbi:MAG: molybdopterin-guanine dinucleotide biosynthesis protein B [Burkholderiales bacterium]|nr:MAG: molybdopterin-guanine dinucleotide biosynthesis protein B [Burkholderiales bacterium]